MMKQSNGEAQSRWAILAHPEDVHCVVFHLLTLAAYGCAFWLYLHPELVHIKGVWSRLAFVAAAAIMLGWIAGIDLGVNFHNHTHRRIFRVEWLNRWFGRLWTFSSGWPSFYWWHAHVVVHHTHGRRMLHRIGRVPLAQKAGAELIVGRVLGQQHLDRVLGPGPARGRAKGLDRVGDLRLALVNPFLD